MSELWDRAKSILFGILALAVIVFFCYMLFFKSRLENSDISRLYKAIEPLNSIENEYSFADSNINTVRSYIKGHDNISRDQALNAIDGITTFVYIAGDNAVKVFNDIDAIIYDISGDN